MMLNYKITYHFEYEQQDFVWAILPMLELMAKLRVGIKHVECDTNYVGDTNLMVHYCYRRRHKKQSTQTEHA